MGTSPAVTVSETMDRTVCLELRVAKSAGLEHSAGTVGLPYFLTCLLHGGDSFLRS